MNQHLLSSVEKAIETLMKDSHWAKAQDIVSLSKALRNELDEFITSFELKDSINTLSEVGDIIMILLCCLQHQLGISDKELLPEVLNEIKSKLYRRFSHLYKSETNAQKQLPLFLDKSHDFNKLNIGKYIPDKKAEDIIWEKSKEKEIQEKFAFCTNAKSCKYAFRVGSGNMCLTGSAKMKCNNCKRVYRIQDSTLFPGRTTSREKILTSIAKLFNKDIALNEAYFSLMQNERRNIKSWVVGSLQSEKALKNVLEKRYGILKDETDRLINLVLKNSFYSVRTIHAKEAEYYARSWNKQKAIRYILKLSQNQSIEAMAIYHYFGEHLRDVTVEVSNMYGCPVGCSFCASNDLKTYRKLESLSYLKQVNTCLKHEKIVVDDLPEFQVSFAGIGEPSIVAREVLEGGMIISRIYPNVSFNIATCGINAECFDIWKTEHFPVRTIQIPYYHNDERSLKKICPKGNIPSVVSILPKALFLSGANKNCRVKINYILINGINDDTGSLENFLETIESYKDSLTIKLSFLNPTSASQKMGLSSPKEEIFQNLLAFIRNQGFFCYIFGTESDPEIGCGQLAAESCIKKNIDDCNN